MLKSLLKMFFPMFFVEPEKTQSCSDSSQEVGCSKEAGQAQGQ